MPDRTTSAGNGVDMVTDSPESSILSEVALFRGLPAEQLSKIGARLRRMTLPAGAHVITVEEAQFSCLHRPCAYYPKREA